MDKLVVSSREMRLQSLQALTEMQEYINFKSKSGMVGFTQFGKGW